MLPCKKMLGLSLIAVRAFHHECISAFLHFRHSMQSPRNRRSDHGNSSLQVIWQALIHSHHFPSFLYPSPPHWSVNHPGRRYHLRRLAWLIPLALTRNLELEGSSQYRSLRFKYPISNAYESLMLWICLYVLAKMMIPRCCCSLGLIFFFSMLLHPQVFCDALSNVYLIFSSHFWFSC